MVKIVPTLLICFALVAALPGRVVLAQQQMGGIRGSVTDKDFDAPMAVAQVRIDETGDKTITTDEGNYVFQQVKPGKYTLVFWKDGYVRQVKADVIVEPGRMTEVNVSLSGAFEEMEEFVVQELKIGGAEAKLLELRAVSPSFIDSISSDWMSRVGAGDAASALSFVAGATVQDGKYAVVRGLPDRYVNSQMNSVRLPTADPDKRAVQLDQFPSDVIESVQVSKTFTPDQQGDASGGAVNVVLKGIPDRNVLKLDIGSAVRTQVTGRKSFLSYKGGGLNFLGGDDGDRDIQYGNMDDVWGGAVGVTGEQFPMDYDFSIAAGGKHEFDTGLKVGGFTSFYYERDNSFTNDAVDHSYWVESGSSGRMTPQYSRGTPSQSDFKTSLFDVTKGSQELQWGWLGVVGAETKNHKLNLAYMYTRSAEDTAILAEDTMGKASLHRFWPQFYGPEYENYNPNDPRHPGNMTSQAAAPYLRTETLQRTERTTQTLQLSGRHTLAVAEMGIDGVVKFLYPEFDWTVAKSFASENEPDKRRFGTLWEAAAYNPGIPFLGIPPSISDPQHREFKPAANFNMGYLQRTWRSIEEDSDQYFYNIKFPFEQWDGEKGYVKLGVFSDQLTREYDQESFSNLGLLNFGAPKSYQANWEDYWSNIWPTQEHIIGDPEVDVDYTGTQGISAWYYMVDMPLSTFFNVIGGVRFENTELEITTDPDVNVKWIPPDDVFPRDMIPGEADVSFKQEDVLPSLGFVFEPFKEIKLRGSYSRTIARQTFKELSPVMQSEFLGGDVFIGNPELEMSALENKDLRLDYTPYRGGLVSVSWFHKMIEKPIEYVQRRGEFGYTTAINYPEGEISGYELEMRQRLGVISDTLQGVSVGANATFIDSEVLLPSEEIENLERVGAPMKSRDMTNAPKDLYNLYVTYDSEELGLKVGLAYTVRGDTLVVGAGEKRPNFIPSVYELEYGTLNLTVAKKLGEYATLSFKAKNLLDPPIEEVYRSKYIGADVTKTSYRKGMEFWLGLSISF